VSQQGGHGRFLDRSLVAVVALLLTAALGPTMAHATGGEYSIQGLPQDSFQVEFSAPEGSNLLSPVFFNGKPSLGAGDPVTVTPPGVTGGINATFATGGEISGRVTAAGGGAPLQGIEVCAAPLVGFFGGCATTNANGEYIVPGLRTTEYEVGFFPPEGTDYLYQYYNAKVSYEEANPVSVTAGATTPNINAALAGGAQIAGTVTDTVTKAPVANVFVCARFFGAGPYEYFFTCTRTNASGEYVTTGLPPGMYAISFDPPQGADYQLAYYKEKSYNEEWTLVEVNAGETKSNIDEPLKAGGQITGTVTGAVSKAPVNSYVCALPAPSDYPYGGCGETNGAGEYTITGLFPHEYKVSFGVGEGNYLPQYYNNKPTYGEADKLAVEAGKTKSGINAALATGGQITGRVTSAASGTPLANISACTFGACGVTDANGEYAIVGLSSRSNYLVFFEALPEAGNYAPQLYNAKKLTEKGDELEVKAGETKSGIDAALTAGGIISGTVTAADGTPLGGVNVCAYTLESEENFFFTCAATSAPPPPGPKTETPGGGTTPPVTLPNSAFAQRKPPRFNRKTGNLEFFFTVANPGTFRWKLSFRNADVGFADSLASGAKAKRCRHGLVRHRGRCVHATVPFSKGSKTVPAGAVVVKVHASAKSLKALRAGRTLHVSGPFTFQSALGGAPVTHPVHAVVHVKKKRSKAHAAFRARAAGGCTLAGAALAGSTDPLARYIALQRKIQALASVQPPSALQPAVTQLVTGLGRASRLSALGAGARHGALGRLATTNEREASAEARKLGLRACAP
jgi:hypothetical protein